MKSNTRLYLTNNQLKMDNKAFLEQIKREVAEKRKIEQNGLLEHIKKIEKLRAEGKLLAAAEEIMRRAKIESARKEAIASPPAGSFQARGRNADVAIFRNTIWL